MTQFDTLRLDALVSSPTNPRKNFNPVRLQELADSIAASGVHQPILVRPLPARRLEDTAHLKPRPTHEIVAGERRYRASQLAKVDTIPAMIRALTDDQVLEIQIVENIQRDSLTELETAEGYQLLIDRTGIKPEEIGLKVGKSRSSVYGSLKLLDLHPYGKEVLREDSITASHALLIARISDIKLQHKAVDYAAAADDYGHTPSIRTFQAWLRDNVMLDLVKVPFPIDVKTLIPSAGSCLACDKRTGYNPGLFADVKSDMCTHPPCYHLKIAAHQANLAAMVKAIPKESNKNVDDQQGLGLVSTLAQDARAQQSKDRSLDQLKFDIECIKEQAENRNLAVVRIAIFDACKDHIKATADEHAHDLIAVDMLRAWLVDFFDRQGEDWIFEILEITIDQNANSEDDAVGALQKRAILRIKAASDSDIYRYTALAFLIEERSVNSYYSLNPTPFFDAFAADQGLDLEAIRLIGLEEAKEEMRAKIAAISKQIKTAKNTSTPPPAGAASDAAAADAKKQKPAPLRKAKTSAQEAISGIAAAMQGMETEPLDASLGGSEAAAGDSGKLAVGAKVKILSGKHEGKEAVVKIEVSSDMWSVEIGNMFSIYLPTKSLEVIA